jgi:1,2-diacylglycerol 3-alpha-glucosyltransferase
MKIGIVTNWTNSGAGEVSKIFRNNLKNHGHDVFVYARNEELENLFESNDESIYFGKKSLDPFPKKIHRKDFERWISDKNIETIIFNEQIWILPVIWARNLGVKVIAYVDYYREDTVEDFMVYDALICNTKRHFNLFSWHPQAFYFPWGIELDLFQEANTPDFRTDFFHSCGSSPIRKGTDILLQAIDQVKSKTLTIHSQNDLITMLPEYAKLIRSLVSEKKLFLVTGNYKPPGLYKMGHVYVYPNRLDGLGLTVYEALASGLPVITVDFAPMNEIVNAKNGLLIKPSKIWCRSDGYYWPMHEISVSDLAEALTREDNGELKLRELENSNLDVASNLELFSSVITSAPRISLDYDYLTKVSQSAFYNRFSIQYVRTIEISLKLYLKIRNFKARLLNL